ncbi:hypothetical protein PR003_g8155 [Phytophthora rubi]|uniref:Uncharacterized protein n=1 Tax=Phytophthora rubi TaxID=129364 RepID=A0A6A4FJV7_9STRA|nr:hypothetical protein PR001_g8143 [Phytophthora rubi]KAE9345029.1 hypothetical protein PR003_g8155 [Phytophthora rubi]
MQDAPHAARVDRRPRIKLHGRLVVRLGRCRGGAGSPLTTTPAHGLTPVVKHKVKKGNLLLAAAGVVQGFAFSATFKLAP